MAKIKNVRVLTPHIREITSEWEEEQEKKNGKEESELEKEVEAVELEKEAFSEEFEAPVTSTPVPVITPLQNIVAQPATTQTPEEAARETGADARATGETPGVRYEIVPYIEAERLARGPVRSQQVYVEQDLESQAVEIRREPVRQLQQPRMRAPLVQQHIHNPFDERDVALPRESPRSQAENPEQKYHYQSKVAGEGARRRRDVF